ncbi:hypothetical protein [Stenomitos frigidus]|uniref:Uncharacterized protein n=1 Tax=Stenomitos frigidus ULC18 TaxID=2107698 RepID=A0A2T1E2S0_9CYAN|nr:hypothetical protein [Stenomitos frigidus]PSB27037.1 hypothetical protein C7B82_17975 [Stenomitos frigidus ULC18]
MHYLRLTIGFATVILLLSACNTDDHSFADDSSQALTNDSMSLKTATPQNTSALDNFVAARRLAWDAAVMVQHPPHSVETWQAARVKWRQAINRLEAIPERSPVAAEAKEKRAVYQSNYAAISDRLTTETTAAERFKAAQTLAWQAAVTVQKPPHSLKVWQRASRKWRAAIGLLQSIPPTTAIALQSQAKLTDYRSNYSAINQRLITENQALLTFRQFSETAARLKSIPDNFYQLNLTPQQVGVSYEDYTRLVEALQQSFNQFATQPDARNHPVYPVLLAAIDDHQTVVKLWKAYLDFKAANTQWLYDDIFDQLVPVSLTDAAILEQKYGLKTYAGGTKVSLRFSAWAIWQKNSQHLQQLQQKLLSLN